jgi:hypothetical protein
MPPLSTLVRAASYMYDFTATSNITYRIMPPMSSNTSHLNLGDNNFYSMKHRGREPEGLSLSFMTPTINSIQNTQPAFQMILLAPGARAVGVGSWPLLGIAWTLAMVFTMSELIPLCSIVKLTCCSRINDIVLQSVAIKLPSSGRLNPGQSERLDS